MESYRVEGQVYIELHDILCSFVNENKHLIRELKGGDIIPRKINLSKPIDEIIELFTREYLKGENNDINK